MTPELRLEEDEVTRWARTRPYLGEPGPRFGSPEWLQLDERDPRWRAAIVRAALAWHHSCRPDVIARELRDELALAARAEARLDREDEWQWERDLARAEHAAGPSWRELCRRRGDPIPEPRHYGPGLTREDDAA